MRKLVFALPLLAFAAIAGWFWLGLPMSSALRSITSTVSDSSSATYKSVPALFSVILLG